MTPEIDSYSHTLATQSARVPNDARAAGEGAWSSTVPPEPRNCEYCAVTLSLYDKRLCGDCRSAA